MNDGHDIASVLKIPKKFSRLPPYHREGRLLQYIAKNPLPPMWELADPHLEHSDVETRNNAKLLALGVAVCSNGHGILEAFFHFDSFSVVWLNYSTVKSLIVQD